MKNEKTINGVKVVKRRKKRTFKRFIKQIIRNVVFFIVGMYWLIFKMILKTINNITTKLFKKLPYFLRAGVIYVMIVLSVMYIACPQVITKTEEVEKELVFMFERYEHQQYEEMKTELETLRLENQQARTIKSLNGIALDIYNKGLEVGLTHEQAILVVSISRHETGNWKSNAFINKNNFGGVMCNTGLKVYNNYNDGLNGFVNLLKNRYFDKGLDTIEKIGAVYCPVGASNDPTGVNVHWIPNVTKFYNEYLSK